VHRVVETLAGYLVSGLAVKFLEVKVSVDDKQIWHWDGGYVLGAATQ
jgi:hypothetical protein